MPVPEVSVGQKRIMSLFIHKYPAWEQWRPLRHLTLLHYLMHLHSSSDLGRLSPVQNWVIPPKQRHGSTANVVAVELALKGTRIRRCWCLPARSRGSWSWL